jgi:hypothetical protein
MMKPKKPNPSHFLAAALVMAVVSLITMLLMLRYLSRYLSSLAGLSIRFLRHNLFPHLRPDIASGA